MWRSHGECASRGESSRCDGLRVTLLQRYVERLFCVFLREKNCLMLSKIEIDLVLFNKKINRGLNVSLCEPML